MPFGTGETEPDEVPFCAGEAGADVAAAVSAKACLEGIGVGCPRGVALHKGWDDAPFRSPK